MLPFKFNIKTSFIFQVGRKGKKQNINLGGGCFYQGTVMHEFVHALG